MNFLKQLFIPKDKAQTVTELESYTVTWKFKTGWGNDTETKHKVFVKRDEAEEFERQLIKSARFIGYWLSTSLKKN